jgi:predicted alpha/beta superfamily hydrolase
MPPVIVVAIINTQRDRDFTPKLVRTTEPPPELSAFGGADAFLAFVGTELVPAVDAKPAIDSKPSKPAAVIEHASATVVTRAKQPPSQVVPAMRKRHFETSA